MPTSNPKTDSWLETPLRRWIPFNFETLLVVLLLIVAVVSRFYDLGARSISHDEVNHVVPAYGLYEGGQYQYDPLSHGPLQFHMMAFSYFLFGDNDYTSRIPAALFSVAIVAAGMILFRRYFGRVGALAAGVMLLISPYMLFYGRYARNEVFIVLWGLLTIYAILRYLERGERWVLFLFVGVNAFHFVDKATSYIFAAMELIFLALYLLDRLARREWPRPAQRRAFLLLLIAAILLLGGAALVHSLGMDQAEAARQAAIQEAARQGDAADLLALAPVLDPVLRIVVLLMGVLGLGFLVWAVVALVRGLGWEGIRGERSFDLVWLLGSLILPLLAGLVPEVLKRIKPEWAWNPRDYLFTFPGWDLNAIFAIPLVKTVICIVLLGVLAILLGVWWNRRQWLLSAVLFYVPFLLFYSTFFTNPTGIWGGFTGALGYWLEQQTVNRGDQPMYYYVFLQIPLYEFLPALGVLVAMVVATARRLWQSQPGAPFEPGQGAEQPVPVVALTVFWSLSSLAAFTYAGEKMPWLTIHIALPMILCTAWLIGWLAERLPRRGTWNVPGALRVAMLAVLAFLAILTARAAYRAAYLFYDYPYEYLVYAHGTDDIKDLYIELEELSQRTTGGTDMVVAYDNDVRYSYWWYMRHWPNRIDFNTEPSRDLRRALAIAVGTGNLAQMGAVVRDDYYAYNYNRLWWPNLDYWNLKWTYVQADYYTGEGPEAPEMSLGGYLRYAWTDHIRPFFTDATVRSAVWQIWLDRDFREWAALRGSNAYSLTDWGVSERMVFYLRKDVTAQVWNYGAEASVSMAELVDPYLALTVPFTAERELGSPGIEPGRLNGPRGIAVAPDGSLYVADARNHRIQRFDPSGQVLDNWGQLGAEPGQFNEPWGVAVAPDGSVYVADTWNHRIQQFSADGDFIRTWGYWGQGEAPEAFYGPRGIAVDGQGRVYVADTGNKRIVVFDGQGNFITQIGMSGFYLGQFDEPVGVAVDGQGNVYVTDTWNQRIQVFVPDPSGLYYTAIAEWPVEGWYGQSLENKPFLAVSAAGTVYVSDPESCRVIEFSPAGQATRVWGDCASLPWILPDGLALDGQGGLWVADAGAGRLIYFEVGNP